MASSTTLCQKAPSTRRCIKTRSASNSRGSSTRQKAPSTRRCIKTCPPPFPTCLIQSQKVPSTRSAYSRELPCGGCQQRQKTASPTASPLNRPSESTRTTPPPRAPSSSTAIKASTPGGFMPGELARFQETSRSQNASTAGAGQADANQNGRHRETRHRPLAAHSSPAHERAGSHATRRPGRPSHPAHRPPLQERRRRRMTRPADSRIAATDSTPIATPVTGSHRSRTLWAEGRSAALVRPFAS
mgnify:FL=1